MCACPNCRKWDDREAPAFPGAAFADGFVVPEDAMPGFALAVWRLGREYAVVTSTPAPSVAVPR